MEEVRAEDQARKATEEARASAQARNATKDILRYLLYLP